MYCLDVENIITLHSGSIRTLTLNDRNMINIHCSANVIVGKQTYTQSNTVGETRVVFSAHF